MDQKLNHVVHDPRTGTIFVSLRPKTRRRAVATLEYPGRVIIDLDAEGDLYGVRLLGVSRPEAEKILKLLRAGPEAAAGDPEGYGKGGEEEKKGA